MASTGVHGGIATHEVAERCLRALEEMKGELSDQGQPILEELEIYLARVVETVEGQRAGLDDTEEAYLLNYTDSITLNDMPVKRGSFVVADNQTPCGIARSRGTSLSSESMENVPLELIKIDSWDDFNVFGLDEVSEGRTLELVVMVLLEELKIFESLKLDKRKMRHFLQDIESLYKQNPYHNHVHAADVVQALGTFLCKDELKSSPVLRITDLELLAMVLAAAVHDVGHPGVTNEFHVNSHSELAVMYNDRSVNENMHASKAFKSMSHDHCNVLEGLEEEDYNFVRRTMINIILATDMAAHKKLLSQFSVHVETGAWSSAEARSALFQMLVHAADISNPARPWELSSVWSGKVLEELFAQGDLEEKLKMPLSPLCDRHQVEQPKSQATFLKYMVKPSFELLKKVAPESSELALSHIDKNINRWDNMAAENHSGPGTPPGNNCLSGANGN